MEALRTALEPFGLNLWGVADPAEWDAAVPESRRIQVLFPETRSIVVIGSGGGALWDAFLEDLRLHPEHLYEEPHPLDAFVMRKVLEADAALGDTPRRWFWASALADLHIDFRLAAHLAGLGGRSRLGLLLHPQYGPWLGLRAACFLASPLPFSVPGGPDLCQDCPAPCLSACPGGAFPQGTWEVGPCSTHKLEGGCFATCHSRLACPVGTPYSPLEVQYHYDRASGREQLREFLGIPAEKDHYRGEGPYWGAWKQRIRVS